MSCRTRLKACRSWTRPCQSRPAHTVVRPCAHKKHANQSLLPGSSPGGLCGAPSSAGQVKSPFRFFSKKYCFSNFSFSGQSFHQKQTPGSIPGDAQAEFQAIRSFIHACLVSSSSKFLDRLWVKMSLSSTVTWQMKDIGTLILEVCLSCVAGNVVNCFAQGPRNKETCGLNAKL